MDRNRKPSNIRLEMEINKSTIQCLTGSREFIYELKGRTFKSAEAITNKIRGQDLNHEFVVKNGFHNPILIEKPDGLDLSTPKIHDWDELEQYIGGDKSIELIDVENQDYLITTFSTMITYMKKQKRTKLLNLISLECSNTSLGKVIKPPSVAVQLDWVTKYWTTKKVNNDTAKEIPPQVQKYCLVSPMDAYTDFHIDFGGTSVWYHIVKGAKTFYLIPPTADNMLLYTSWIESANRSRTFFGDQVESCYKINLYPGNTLLLPTGWIHAVLTVEDSLVFGGNFLHSLNIQGQLEIYDLERRQKTPSRLMYPLFEEVHWRAARGLTKELEDINSSSSAAPPYLLNGLKTLMHYLKQWNSSPSFSASAKEKETTIKELTKHLKIAERIVNLLNPPKPERESTRPRKKRVQEDFIDYSPLTSKKKPLKNKRHAMNDFNDRKATGEKWDIQNGGTKIVFRRLSREQVYESLIRDKPLFSFEGDEAEKSEEEDIIVISSSDSEASNDALGSNQLRVTNLAHNSHSFGRNFNVSYPSHTVAECCNNEKIEPNNLSEGHKGVVVHQDDDYIYPSLLLSADEVKGCKIPTKDNDTPWNPKAKVGIVARRTDRPSRTGKQKVAVGKGLEAAALVANARTLQRPKDLGKKTIAKRSGSRGFCECDDSDDSTKGLRRVIRPGLYKPVAGRKNSTVKQRLGKILKLRQRLI